MVFSAIRSASTSRSVPKGLVEIDFSVLADEVVGLLEAAFPGQPFCLDGSDPADVVQPGPQQTEGDGWTLVGHRQKDGPPWFRTGIATDRGQLESLWTLAEMPGDAPAADFVESVVVWFADPHGSSCTNQRLDHVIVDHERSTIYPYIVDPDNPMACTSDLRGAHHFFMSLERDRLPSPPVWMQLGP